LPSNGTAENQFSHAKAQSRNEFWTAAGSEALRRFDLAGKSAVAAPLCQRSPKVPLQLSTFNRQP
jgi:hypothetical protein